MKRRKMGKQESRSNFQRHASKTNPRNTQGNPMRGGIRL